MNSPFASVLRSMALPAAIALTVLISFGAHGPAFAQTQADGTAADASSNLPANFKSVTMVQEGTGGVALVRPEVPNVFANGFSQFLGVTSLNTTVTQMSLNHVMVPPGASGPRNLHKQSESILMVYQGTMTALIGEKGEKRVTVKPGEFLFIPGDVWHQWTNEGTEPVSLVEARKDADPSQNLYIIPTP